MNAFLLIAHGSRRKESNDEVHALSKKIIEQNSGQFDELRCCFLELAKPLIPDAIEQLVLNGANQINLTNHPSTDYSFVVLPLINP